MVTIGLFCQKAANLQHHDFLCFHLREGLLYGT